MPSLQGAVKKIRSLLETHKLQKVFVATDAVEEGRQIIVSLGLITFGNECSNYCFVFINDWKFTCLHNSVGS